MRPILFFHVAKCAGTTVLENARLILGNHNVFDIAESIDPLSEVDPYAQLLNKQKEIIKRASCTLFVHDPYGVISPHLLPKHQAILIIREPRKRYISYINMIVNYTNHDISVAPSRSLKPYEALLNLEDDDIKGAEKTVKPTAYSNFFRNNWTNDDSIIDGLTHVFELEYFHEFEYFFCDWASVDRNFLETFNEGGVKKFASYKQVLILNSENETYRKLQVYARFRRIKKFIKTPKTINIPIIERVDFDQYGLGDFYAVENNVVGPSRWISSRQVCYIPLCHNEILILLSSNYKLRFVIANAIDSESIFDINAYIVMQINGRKKAIKMHVYHSTMDTPFAIEFFLKGEYESNLTLDFLSVMLIHNPKKLTDGRVSSLQLSRGEVVECKSSHPLNLKEF